MVLSIRASFVALSLFSMRRRPLRSSLFPYTTLFRSHQVLDGADLGVALLQARAHARVAHRVRIGRQRHDRVEIDAVKQDRKSTRLNSSHVRISYAVLCLKKKK